MKCNRIVKLMLSLGICLGFHACHTFESERYLFPIESSEHTLLPLSPDFSVQTTEAALHKEYLQLHNGKTFSMIGIIRVDGKSYRFLGGDSLRIHPLATLSGDSRSWAGTYSYLFPGADWQQRKYDDSNWYEGVGAFGTEKHSYPVHTAWSANEVYVRRHVFIKDKDALKEHKLYMRYICDDHASFFCNGERILDSGYLAELECLQLSEQVIDQLQNGDNVFAAYAYDMGGGALLDFGLYMENKLYSEADTATLKQVDMQATQTHYIYQCGEVELQLSFVSPALLKEKDVTGCPVAFLTYQVYMEGEEHHDVEILFDVDVEWMFGNVKNNCWTDRDWSIAQIDNLYLSMAADETMYSFKDGHVVYSQKLCGKNEDGGVLLFAYDKDRTLQYEGENLFPYWNRSGNKTITDLLRSVGDEYEALKKDCNEADYHWNEKAFRMGGDIYAGQIIPSYRNFMSTHYLEISLDNQFLCFGNSLGNVREAFRDYSTLLFFDRTDLLKGLLEPVFEYCENDFWIKKYPPYDIGSYPIVNRQISAEDHGIEVAADMLMMVAAIVESEHSFDYAESHWALLCKWADFLINSMPEEELTFGKLWVSNEESGKRALGFWAYKRLMQLREEYD